MSQPRDESLFIMDAMLKRLEAHDHLLPGARDRILTALHPHVSGPTNAAKTLMTFLQTQGEKYLANPKGFDKELEPGISRAKFVAKLMPIAKSSRDEAIASVSSVAHDDPSVIAEKLAYELQKREHRGWCVDPPALPVGERRCKTLLDAMSPWLRPNVDTAELAAKFGSSVNGLSTQQAILSLASKLEGRGYADVIDRTEAIRAAQSVSNDNGLPEDRAALASIYGDRGL